MDSGIRKTTYYMCDNYKALPNVFVILTGTLHIEETVVDFRCCVEYMYQAHQLCCKKVEYV